MGDKEKDGTIEIPFSENSEPNAGSNDEDTVTFRPENPPSKPDTDNKK